MLNQLTEAEGVSRFANTADFYDNGKTGPDGQRTTIDTSTGKQTTSSGSGIDVTSVQGTPISHTRPSFDGATSVKTYTGSAQGKGVASGGQKLRYNDGSLDATQYQDPAGKQTSANMSYDMGIAKANVNQQGDENAPIQTSMKYVQPDGSYADNRPDQPQTMEEEAALEEIRRLAFGKEELDEVGEYAGDNAAYEKYAEKRGKVDMMNKELTGDEGSGIKTYTNPQLQKVAGEVTASSYSKNPEMEKRYTMNKLTAPAPTNPYSPEEIEESELDAMRRIMNHRR